MFEGILAWMVNAIATPISAITKRKMRHIEADDLAKVDIRYVLDHLYALLRAVLDWIDKELNASGFARLSNALVDSMKRRMPALPFRLELSFLKGQNARSLLSPLIFIVGFIAFMGLSDHGISPFALWSAVASLTAYFLGTRVAKLRIGDLSDRYALPLIALLGIMVAAYFAVGENAAKISLIPLFILIFSERYCGKISLCAFVGGYLLFKEGNMTVGFPYLLIGTLGLARSIRTEKIASFIERNAHILAIFMIGVGLLYLVLDIALAGRIPLLTDREGLDPTYTMRSHLLPIGSVLMVSLLGEWGKRTGNLGKARMASLVTVVLASALIALLGYRTQVLITLLASIIVAIAWDLITVTEIFITGSAIVTVFALMTILRTYTTGANVGLLESISLRTGLTLDIYDMMAKLGGYLGFTKGQTIIACISDFAKLMPGFAYSPRRYVAIFAGGEGISMTSTMLGPFALDFGLVGTVLILGVFGFFLQKEYSLVKTTTGKRKSVAAFLYSLTLGYMLVGIETGLVDYEVLVLFAFSFLYTIYLSHIAQD